MANSNTEHSKRLRRESARNWSNKNAKNIFIALNAEKDKEIIAEFEAIDAKSNAERFRKLMAIYSLK